MKVDNEAFDFLMTLARRTQIITDSKPSETIMTVYQESWANELMLILNKCTVLDESGGVARSPVVQQNGND